MGIKLVYVVDDEQNIRDLVKTYLQKEGFDVAVFSDGETAFKRFQNHPADMLVIDIMMPGMDGYALCREIRKISEVPIIMVSAKDDEIDRILGLELGSDDYISKPFSPRELIARIRTIFRRVKSDNSASYNNTILCQDIMVYPDERKVITGEQELELTAKEYDFLLFMIKNRNRVFTRDQLVTNIWGYDYTGEERIIDDLVKRIRKKLSKAESKLEITTIWGYGYKISG